MSWEDFYAEHKKSDESITLEDYKISVNDRYLDVLMDDYVVLEENENNEADEIGAILDNKPNKKIIEMKSINSKKTSIKNETKTEKSDSNKDEKDKMSFTTIFKQVVKEVYGDIISDEHLPRCCG